MKHMEYQVDREKIYDGAIFNVYKDYVKLENGNIVPREVIEHPGAVGLVAFSPSGNLLLVEQYRYGNKQVMLELPAGKIDLNEDPLTCGARELEEETGYKAEKLTLITKMFPAAAYDSELIYLYYAENLVLSKQRLDDDEFLSVVELPFDDVLEQCINGEITDSKTQVGIMTFHLQRERGILK